MRFLRYLKNKFLAFCLFLLKDRRNLIIFTGALPIFFMLYLVGVFTTSYFGLSDYFTYRQVKDKDKILPIADPSVVYLEQGWKERYRQQYYFTPQGSPIIPLDIALVLEMPDSDELIFGKNGTAIKQFGYLAYPDTDVEVSKTETVKTHGLPVGFTIEETKDDQMLGINCAACHTSHIEYGGDTIRVDGGAALGDFMGLINAIDDGLQATIPPDPEHYSPWADAKFKRMVARLELVREAEKQELKDRLQVASARRQAWQARNSDNQDPDNPHGHGRVDAFGIIFNQVLGKDLHQDTPPPVGNVYPPTAPVSYPVLWDTPFMGRVQWNGSANNVSRGGVLGRNTGQVLGVFGSTEITTQSGLPGYCSTVNRRNLQLFDYWIKALESPKWEDAYYSGVLPALEPALLAKGEEIYNGKGACAACHAVPSDAYRNEKDPYKGKNKKTTCELPFAMVPLDQIRTDPSTIETGTRGGAKAGILAGQPIKKDPDRLVPAEDSYINILREVVAGSIAGSFQSMSCKREFGIPSMVETASGFGKLARGRRKNEFISGAFELRSATNANGELKRDEDGNIVDECPKPTRLGPNGEYNPDGYKARPLNGIWASAPYLHNGSVPTLYDLLSPPNDRPDTFYVGSASYDPKKVGFETERAPNATRFDTSRPGNLNSGHEYGLGLSEAEKMALIEYLKSL